MENEILVDVQGVSHSFLAGRRTVIQALTDVSFQIRKGEVFGLVGESGSGKSTLARCIMNLCRPREGRILYRGVDTCAPALSREYRRMLSVSRQLIFQDANSSLNPRMKAADIVTEPFVIRRSRPKRGNLREEAAFWLRAVGMEESYLDRYPPELSGGQRQRVAIARALCMEPELLVADEPVASLDVSIQAQIVNLFRRLREEHGFSLLFIAHDLAMVEYVCDRVGVLCQGRLVETAPARELYDNPLHPYTQALLSAVPIPDPIRERKRKLLVYKPEPSLERGRLTRVGPDHYVRMTKEA